MPAPVRNLADGAPSVSMDKVVAAVGQMYLRQAGKQASRGFQMVNPTDEWFPGESGRMEGRGGRGARRLGSRAAGRSEVATEVESGRR